MRNTYITATKDIPRGGNTSSLSSKLNINFTLKPTRIIQRKVKGSYRSVFFNTTISDTCICLVPRRWE